MKTAQEYKDSLRQRNIRVYVKGELLESDKEICGKYPVNLPQVLDRSYESDIINQKYDFIDEIIHEVMIHKQRQDRLTEKLCERLKAGDWLIICGSVPA